MAIDDDEPKSTPGEELSKEYYLGSSDAPGNIITPIKLRGSKNYDEWAASVRRALISKRKFGFVEGKIKEPTDPDRLADWIAVHSMLISWISHTLDESLRSTVGDFDDAGVMWLYLKTRFCVVSGTRLCQLKKKLWNCKQQPNDPVPTYYGSLSTLWKEYIAYARVPRCSCGACKCDIAGQINHIRAEDYLHYFLIGLDTPYKAIRAQLLARSPLPSVEDAYLNVCNTEYLREEQSHDRREPVVAFKIEARSRTRDDNNDKFCNHCNKGGHDEDGCFQLIGYPEWWPGDRRGGRGSSRPGNKGGRMSGGRSSSVGGSNNGGGMNAGASNHCTSDLSLLMNIQTIPDCPVGLPDGQTAYTNQSGSVKLEGGLVLDNVLFVPRLNCNLISVTQLSDESNCVVQFTNKICVMQDRSTRTMIGLGVRKDGLYFFRGIPLVKLCS
ncbi:uncharacterized protein [Spinacia oleracea]|uniref:Uncharacterized protein isoform X2 n=1 Tax=Spinacia oleracea TaxID=3562 RepID=A0ABM3QHS5_SPIOL|nr:uncharacterized protein LOC110774670 isoform X2 [Spinacia oleracea]